MAAKRYQRKHWRVVIGDGFSFHIDRVPYHVEYRVLFWWSRVSDPHGIGYLSFLSNEEAVAWINEREPISIVECGEPPILKPEHWNDQQFATGNYGKRHQIEAIVRLQTVKQ